MFTAALFATAKTGQLSTDGWMGKEVVMEFSCGAVGWGSGIVAGGARVADVKQIRSLAQALPYAGGVVKKIKKNKRQFMAQRRLWLLAWRSPGAVKLRHREI